jgi:hypothetical protein
MLHASSISLITALAGLCLLLPGRVLGQGGERYGLALGYEYGVPLAIERSPGVINRYAFGGEGRSYNHTIAAGGRMIFPALFGAGIGISANAGFAISRGSFRSVAFAGDSVLSLSDQAKVVPTEEFVVTSKQSLLLVDLRARLGIGERLGIEIGPWGSFWTSSAITQTERILAPAGAVFPDSSSERVVASGDDIAAGRFRYGLGLSASYGFDLTYALSLRPELFTRIDASALDRGIGLKALTAGAGMALLYDPGAAAPVDTTPPPTVAEDRVPKSFLLEAKVRLTAGEGAAKVRAESIRHRTYAPFLPVIFSDSGSSSIPARYALLPSTADADRFGRDDLARLTPLELHHQALNILGMRLRGEPSATVTLTGYASGAEEGELARGRGEAVAAYLRDVWGIGAGRIIVKAGRGPGSVARGVEIASGSSRVTAPVVAEWIVRDLYLPKIGVAREIRAEAGVRRWDVMIRQGVDTISRYSSIDEERGEEMDAAFHLGSGAESSVGPLVAELVVEDYTGAKVTAHDSMLVTWGERSEGRIDRELFEYLLPDLDRPSGQIAGGSRVLMESLGRSLRGGAHVTITGAGRDGRRVEEIARKVIDACAAGGGSPAELHILSDAGEGADTALPESSIIDSCVRVTIEQEPPADRSRP